MTSPQEPFGNDEYRIWKSGFPRFMAAPWLPEDEDLPENLRRRLKDLNEEASRYRASAADYYFHQEQEAYRASLYKAEGRASADFHLAESRRFKRLADQHQALVEEKEGEINQVRSLNMNPTQEVVGHVASESNPPLEGDRVLRGAFDDDDGVIVVDDDLVMGTAPLVVVSGAVVGVVRGCPAG